MNNKSINAKYQRAQGVRRKAQGARVQGREYPVFAKPLWQDRPEVHTLKCTASKPADFY